MNATDLPTVCDIIKKTDKVLFVMDKEGTCLSRAWCVYELLQTLASSGDRGDKVIPVMMGWDWPQLIHPFTIMDVSKATSYVEKDKLLIQSEIQKCGHQLESKIKEMLLLGAKREIYRAEKLSSVVPRRMIEAISTQAWLLFLSYRYMDAEESLRGIKALIDKVALRELGPQDEPGYYLHMAMIAREKGVTSDMEKHLSTFISITGAMTEDDMFLQGSLMMSQTLLDLKHYTKAERHSRKLLDHRRALPETSPAPPAFASTSDPNTNSVDQWMMVSDEQRKQTRLRGMVDTILHLSAISRVQLLYEEADERAHEALDLVLSSDEGPYSQEAASCYGVLAECNFYSDLKDLAESNLEKALSIRTNLMGVDHPLTLSLKELESRFMIEEGRWSDAETLLTLILKARAKTYGLFHHDTLRTLGTLSEVQRRLKRTDDAEASEKKLFQAGKDLLKRETIDRFKSLDYVARFLTRNDDAIEKASNFLARAYVTYKEKVPDMEITERTKGQLETIAKRAYELAMEALEHAQIFSKDSEFIYAENMFKQSYNLGKLAKPDGDHSKSAEGLADALFGQGKATEAKNVMRSAGLMNKGTKGSVPTSYLRWLNKRVANFLDKQNDPQLNM